MSAINKVILVGRLGADPKQQTFNSGKSAVSFDIATSYRSSEGTVTDWHRVKTFGPLADLCAKHLSKGRLCYIEGRLHHYRAEKEDQPPRYFTEVIAQEVSFLGPKPDHASTQPPASEDTAIPF